MRIELFRVDWQRLALALRRSGASLPAISESLGKHSTWLADIARGDVRKVEFTDGLALLECAAEHLATDELLALRRLDPINIITERAAA